MVCYGGGPGNVSYSNAFTLKEMQNRILDDIVAQLVIPEGADEAALAGLAATVSLSDVHKVIEDVLVPMHKQMNIDLSTVTHH